MLESTPVLSLKSLKGRRWFAPCGLFLYPVVGIR